MVSSAVIGAGRMGRRHVQILRRIGADIVGVADVVQASLDHVSAEAHIPRDRLFLDPSKMIEATRPQLVVVSTTAPTHADLTVLAAQSGAKYVLCEKPMATSLADCDRMIAACKKGGTLLAINHQMRYMDQYTKPRALLLSEVFGGLSSISVVAGNFGMSMNGTHYFEMLRYMAGADPVSVSAWFSEGDLPNPRGPEFKDKAGSVRVETANGVRFYMDIGADQGHGMLVVYGARHGRIVVDELSGWMHTVARMPEHRKEPTTRYGMPSIEEDSIIEPADVLEPTRRVLDDLLNGRDYPSAEHGRLAVATTIAAYVSDRTGHGSVGIDDVPRDEQFPWA